MSIPAGMLSTKPGDDASAFGNLEDLLDEEHGQIRDGVVEPWRQIDHVVCAPPKSKTMSVVQLPDLPGECAKLWGGLVSGDEMDNQAGI
jgi:hypothetical protein